MSNIIGLDGARKEDVKPTAKPGNYEFHLHPNEEGGNCEVVSAEGYLKFGPQFVAVVDGPEDASNVMFASATHLIKWVKRISEDGSVEGTLSPTGA